MWHSEYEQCCWTAQYAFSVLLLCISFISRSRDFVSLRCNFLWRFQVIGLKNTTGLWSEHNHSFSHTCLRKLSSEKRTTSGISSVLALVVYSCVNWIILYPLISSLFYRWLFFLQSAGNFYLLTFWKSLLTVLMIISRYVEFEHIRHCVPSNVSSGLANLPLKYVWVDGIENKSWPTNPYLPTGEPLNGKQAYSQIMSYFTTNAMTPKEVHELGIKQLDFLYPMVSVNIFGFQRHLESEWGKSETIRYDKIRTVFREVIRNNVHLTTSWYFFIKKKHDKN